MCNKPRHSQHDFSHRWCSLPAQMRTLFLHNWQFCNRMQFRTAYPFSCPGNLYRFIRCYGTMYCITARCVWSYCLASLCTLQLLPRYRNATFLSISELIALTTMNECLRHLASELLKSFLFFFSCRCFDACMWITSICIVVWKKKWDRCRWDPAVVVCVCVCAAGDGKEVPHVL